MEQKFVRPQLGKVWYFCEFLTSLALSFIIMWSIFRTPNWIVDPKNGQIAAAWVQAIGSVLAIGVAIAIPEIQRRRETAKEVKRQKRADYRCAAMSAHTIWKLSQLPRDIFGLAKNAGVNGLPKEQALEAVEMPLLDRGIGLIAFTADASPELQEKIMFISNFCSRVADTLNKGMNFHPNGIAYGYSDPVDIQDRVNPLSHVLIERARITFAAISPIANGPAPV